MSNTKPKNIVTVLGLLKRKMIPIQDMRVGDFATVYKGGTACWTAYRTPDGVLFLEDFDFLVEGQSRFDNSSFMVELLPPHMKLTVDIVTTARQGDGNDHDPL